MKRDGPSLVALVRHGSVYGPVCRVCRRYKHQCLNPTDVGKPVERAPHTFQPVKAVRAWRP